MRLPRFKTILLAPLILFGVFYIVGVIVFSLNSTESLAPAPPLNAPIRVAVFGASGTAGDGILKAALASRDIDEIHVVTRRETTRIRDGVAAGKVKMIIHSDYMDYSDVINQLSEIDAVFWAIGISSLGADEKTYGMIHVDLPLSFINAWRGVSDKLDTSFHFISSSDISEQSTTMWIREKIRAEKMLFEIAKDTNLRVIAYRPDYIGPTKEEANIGQTLLYWFFKPVGAAVRATQIGQAMIDLAVRGNQIKHGTKISTRKIILHSQARTQG